MATLKYFTRNKDIKSDKLVPVYCRFTAGRGADYKVKTGIQLKPSHFNNKTGKIRELADFKNKQRIEKKLRDLKSHIYDNLALLNGKPDKDWLVTTIDKYHNPDKYKPKIDSLFSFMQEYIDKAPTRTSPKTGNPVCYKQLREYERTFYHLKEYAADRGVKLDFKDITLDFYHDFLEYLQSEKTVTNKTGKAVKVPGLAKNTIGKKIQTLKIFLNAASDQGINTNRQFKSHRFKAVTEDSENIHLTVDELTTISDLDLSEDKSLDRVRDLFLIGCWTGLRYSDWNKVTQENIKDGFLELKQAKTGGEVVIPLHPIIEAVISKYEGILPPVISNQKFNDYLKKVAEQAEIKEIVHKAITKGGQRVSKAYKKHQLVTTHTARRSFATNLYNAGVPTLTIMAITGHKTEAAFLKYIKVTPREHAQKLKEFWQNQVKLKVV